jgi:hypothetical protein
MIDTKRGKNTDIIKIGEKGGVLCLISEGVSGEIIVTFKKDAT